MIRNFGPERAQVRPSVSSLFRADMNSLRSSMLTIYRAKVLNRVLLNVLVALRFNLRYNVVFSSIDL